MTNTKRNEKQYGELASNLFHAVVAGLFGLMTLTAALHVVNSLA